MSLENKMLSISKKTDETMHKYFSCLKGIDNSLLGVIQYSVFSGGKRLRPCILVMFYELCGGKLEDIYQIACALEMIHSYSLIHDDLPCMDNDEFRRGKKCAHIVYGEDMAILAGDALITQAFEALLDDRLIESFGYNIILSAAKTLASFAGSCGMVSGQAMEIAINKDKNTMSEHVLIDMYTKKTGKLFSAAAKIGAICAGQDKHKTHLAEEYGKYFGIVYQLCDDIADENQDKENKITYLSVYGKEKTKDLIYKYYIKAVQLLEEFQSNDSKLLKNIIEKIAFRGE